MLLQGRPLYDNLADSRLFLAAPAAWSGIDRALERQLNVVVVGARGVGKTTLLRQQQFELREKGERVVFVDAAAVGDPFELATRIRDALLGQPSSLIEGVRRTEATLSRDDAPMAGASRALAEVLREIGGAEPTIVLVDASGSANAVYGIFGRMRDVLWQQGHRWVVAIGDADRASALKPPADAFFDVVLAMDQWSINDLFSLLALRADDDSPFSNDLLLSAAKGADGSPRDALRILGDALVSHRDPSTLLDARERLLARASRIGRPAGMLMAELLDRGQASPSDRDLQASLGVTRSRLTQLLRDLLAQELVIAESERADGPGRPRVIYRPALPR